MSQAKQSTDYPGVRYREHSTRSYKGRPDRYFTIRYYTGSKDHEEGLGWASDGWTPKKAAAVLSSLKEAHQTGIGPQSLAEKRLEVQAKREETQSQARQEEAQSMTLEDFLNRYYLPRAQETKRSWRTDENRINYRIIPALGVYPIRSITPSQITDFLKGLAKEKLSPATVKHHFAILRQAFKLASSTIIEDVAILEGKGPMQELKAPALFNARENFLSYEQADELIAAAKTRNMDLHDAIVLSLNTGLRLGELLRLEWVDVDLTHGIITVRQEEHRKPGGKAFVNDDAHAVLARRREEREKGKSLVMQPRWGKQRENLSHEFKAVVDSLGWNDGVADPVHRIVFHSLRHTFASWLAMAGTDIYRIKTLMRHKTLAMTERYAHLIPDATSAAVHNLRPTKS